MSISRDKEGRSSDTANPPQAASFRERPKSFLHKDPLSFHYTDGTLKAIRDIIFEKEGFDLDSYKDKCIQRRISYRIRTSGCKSVEDYMEVLRRKEEEVKRLLSALTINVTEFFRNRSTFDKLRDIVLPDIFAMKERDRSVRIWSAGCASGEEPYTVAIILKESFPEELKRFDISITATDVDEEIINKAAAGVYTREKLTGVEPTLRDKFFQESGDCYRLSDDIKKMVSFQREDIFQGRLHGENDLVICRNLLIYFSKEKQEWVQNKFWKSLNPGGFLLLGRSEILVGESRRFFLTVCPRERIYRKSF